MHIFRGCSGGNKFGKFLVLSFISSFRGMGLQFISVNFHNSQYTETCTSKGGMRDRRGGIGMAGAGLFQPSLLVLMCGTLTNYNYPQLSMFAFKHLLWK